MRRCLVLVALSSILMFPSFCFGEETSSGKVLSAVELAEFIDRQIAAKWQENNIKPAPMAGDAEFLRRISLDLTGRIPRVWNVRQFLEDSSPNKRTKIIEKLLAGPQYVSHMSNTWRRIMVPQQNDQRARFYANSFQQWLTQKVQANVGYDNMVQQLLRPSTPPDRTRNPYGYSTNNGVSGFYLANEMKPENVAAATSRIFLGVRLECAQCHDHPFASWKRQQFWEYAAFFANLQRSRGRVGIRQRQPVNLNVNLRTLTIPGTSKTVYAKFLDGTTPVWNKDMNPRTVIADWITSPENPYFARTAVNRLWAHCFGIGLVDPVDDEPTKENPPSHPELLAELSRQFIAHQFDVKYILRAITLSKTYQRTSEKTDTSQTDPRFFPRMAVRGLNPEQLFDSLALATGFQEPQGTYRNGVVFRNVNSVRSQFLLKFASQDNPTESQTSILQALTLMNGKFISDATSLEKSRTLGAVLAGPFFSDKERIETLFLATLSRYPREDEMARLTKYVENGGPQNNSQAALADVFWALLNSSEFMLNH